MTPEQVYGACMRTIQQTLEGAGAVRGVPCEIEHIEDQEDAFLMTFKWEERDGSVHRQDMLIPKPIDTSSIYDYDEQIIGSWVNGEPIYRKVIEVMDTTLFQKDKLFKVCDVPADYAMLVKGYGIIQTYERSFSNNDILVYATPTQIMAKQTFTGYPEKIYVVIEYTKREET